METNTHKIRSISVKPYDQINVDVTTQTDFSTKKELLKEIEFTVSDSETEEELKTSFNVPEISSAFKLRIGGVTNSRKDLSVPHLSNKVSKKYKKRTRTFRKESNLEHFTELLEVYYHCDNPECFCQIRNKDGSTAKCELIGSPNYQVEREKAIAAVAIVPVDLTNVERLTLNTNVDMSTPENQVLVKKFISKHHSMTTAFAKNTFPMVDVNSNRVLSGLVFRTNKPLKLIDSAFEYVSLTKGKIQIYAGYYNCVDGYEQIQVALNNLSEIEFQQTKEPIYITLVGPKPFDGDSCVAAIYTTLIGVSSPYVITGSICNGMPALPAKVEFKVDENANRGRGTIVFGTPQDVLDQYPQLETNMKLSMDGSFVVNERAVNPLVFQNFSQIKQLCMTEIHKDVRTPYHVTIDKTGKVILRGDAIAGVKKEKDEKYEEPDGDMKISIRDALGQDHVVTVKQLIQHEFNTHNAPIVHKKFESLNRIGSLTQGMNIWKSIANIYGSEMNRPLPKAKTEPPSKNPEHEGKSKSQVMNMKNKIRKQRQGEKEVVDIRGNVSKVSKQNNNNNNNKQVKASNPKKPKKTWDKVQLETNEKEAQIEDIDFSNLEG